jgi:hypothetical protein
MEDPQANSIVNHPTMGGRDAGTAPPYPVAKPYLDPSRWAPLVLALAVLIGALVRLWLALHGQ